MAWYWVVLYCVVILGLAFIWIMPMRGQKSREDKLEESQQNSERLLEAIANKLGVDTESLLKDKQTEEKYGRKTGRDKNK